MKRLHDNRVRGHQPAHVLFCGDGGARAGGDLRPVACALPCYNARYDIRMTEWLTLDE